MADEVIREVRRVRHEISRRCGHDAHQVVAWYRAFQDELKRAGKHRFFQPDQAGDSNVRESGTNAPVGT
jgi:hypothetical protein